MCYYLDIKSKDFYRVETTIDGKTIVTARAWLNLSDMIRLYEQNGISVDQKMINDLESAAETLAKSGDPYGDEGFDIFAILREIEDIDL